MRSYLLLLKSMSLLRDDRVVFFIDVFFSRRWPKRNGRAPPPMPPRKFKHILRELALGDLIICRFIICSTWVGGGGIPHWDYAGHDYIGRGKDRRKCRLASLLRDSFYWIIAKRAHPPLVVDYPHLKTN